jgi:arsenate reductase
MAEAFLNILYGKRYKGYSGGIKPEKVKHHVVKAMYEIGIGVSKHRSKSIEEFRGWHFNYVVTVCDDAEEACPFFLGEEILHKSFKDPSKFKGTEEEIMEQVRSARDEIKEWVKTTFSRA